MDVRASGSGHPVVFLHGIPTSGCLWNLLVERLAKQFRCLVIDLPYDFRELPALASKLEEIRVRLGIEKWHLVGHDGGCAIAVLYAHRFPSRVDRLGLLSPSMFPDLKPFYLFEPLRWPVFGEMLAPAVNSLFWNVAMPRALGGNRTVIEELRRPFGGLRGAWRLMNLLRWGNPAEMLADIPARLQAINAPAAIFHGLRDPAVPPEFARRTHGLLRHSQLTLLDCGHFLPLHAPDAIAHELLRFFSPAASTVPQTLAATTRMPN